MQSQGEGHDAAEASLQICYPNKVTQKCLSLEDQSQLT